MEEFPCIWMNNRSMGSDHQEDEVMAQRYHNARVVNYDDAGVLATVIYLALCAQSASI